MIKTKLATYISLLGHPLLTISCFAIFSFFMYEDTQKAIFHSLFILGGILVPLTIKMYVNFRKGTTTNFDVSNKSERQSWYIFPILLLLIATIILLVTGQPRTMCLILLFALVLLIISQFVNYFIKSSLHVSLNIYLSFLLMSNNWIFAIIFLGFTTLIAWSRIVLKRHTIQEILAGSIIGFIIGSIALIFI